MVRLNFPREEMTLKGLHSMLMLVDNKVSKMKDFHKLAYKEILENQEEITPLFKNIFRANSMVHREDFFKNPLCLFLWQLLFFQLKPNIMKQYFRAVRSYPSNGE